MLFKNVLAQSINIYITNNILMNFSNLFGNKSHILIIDSKYSFLDDILLEALTEKHKQCYSDITYIKGMNNDFVHIPNVFVIDKLFFKELFINEFYPKNIEINKLIKIAESMHKKLHFIETVYVYKISMVSNSK